METIAIPKDEYFAMKQQIAELNEKIKYFQDENFMKQLNSFINLFYHKQLNNNSVQFKFGAAKDFIKISDDFNEPLQEFNEYM